MGIYRMYTGDNGQTHLEEQNLADHPELTSATAVNTITFNERDSGYFIDWHPAPRRQYVICIEGGIEIGLGDGSLHQFGPGDARLVEDTTGQGHTTRGTGGGKVVTATVPLAD
jgi:hypothetical protein